MLMIFVTVGGCSSTPERGRIIFLDGAGNFSAGPQVRKGVQRAGFHGKFQGFVWTSFLLWGVDHLVAARNPLNAERLAQSIEHYRHDNPDTYLAVMGLSSGTAVVLAALERLPDDVAVDYVVLFQPSVVRDRNLAPAMRHVKGRLYATCSHIDGVLATLAVTADGSLGQPAGRSGFRIPPGISDQDRQQYRKVVNIPWRSKYKRYGWDGGHVSSTRAKFVQHVIAPYVLRDSDDANRRRTQYARDGGTSAKPTAKASPGTRSTTGGVLGAATSRLP